MRVIQPEVEIIDHSNLMKTIEKGGRVCYKSEDKICEGSAAPFVERIKSFKHESVLEHGVVTVRIITDRGVSHELVRHRLTSPSQESTRYCSYNKGKFGGEITVIDIASGFQYDMSNQKDVAKYNVWTNAMAAAEDFYMQMIDLGASAQEARSVLPNSLKTEMVWSANPREWRHIFNLRTHRDAHPQARQVIKMLLAMFRERWPVLFADVGNLD